MIFKITKRLFYTGMVICFYYSLRREIENSNMS